jgi:hypothetical protein
MEKHCHSRMMLGQFWLSMRTSFVAVTKPVRFLSQHGERVCCRARPNAARRDIPIDRLGHRGGSVHDPLNSLDRLGSPSSTMAAPDISCAANRRHLSDFATYGCGRRRPLTKQPHAHSYTVTGCCNFNREYLFTAPCADLP